MYKNNVKFINTKRNLKYPERANIVQSVKPYRINIYK